tara:strand:- start:462 stop:917 length:456 start_codon:yes stop_codon:yes gene_type:complete
LFKGIFNVTVDSKSRLAIPVRLRDILKRDMVNDLVMTLNPWDRTIWLYPHAEWEKIETVLNKLSDSDRHSRRTKQILRGYASDIKTDAQGRILLSQQIKDLARIKKNTIVIGQGNKIEIWDQEFWCDERDLWLESLGDSDGMVSSLENLAL